MKCAVEFYATEDGRNPTREFLASLPPAMRAKMARELALLEEKGPALRMPHSEHLEDGIFEVRATFAGDITRCLYFFWAGQRAVVTHGFVKKTQKTPRAEIERAKRCREDWTRRNA